MSKKNYISNAELNRRLQQQKKQLQQNAVPVQPQYVTATFNAIENKAGLFVHNWRSSWKWFSNWCFGLIVFFAITPIPPEVLSVLPANVRTYVIAFMALCGIALRYINQSKVKVLPPVMENA
ncbi:hypothetical protein [Acinetobacter sp. ANC 3791]|uniref:DUF7940 domain-containing protein n=1 Tax=Acinetobacter sp. ANC 3791 TaxID=2529836 RepID=UPI0010396C90|nr:hypothetical protein [Acinetobacter sp. ANC 3791]TCB83656.1 hypothetical protein E0H90_11000 [Acinetobacter sp. ANC 3791]